MGRRILINQTQSPSAIPERPPVLQGKTGLMYGFYFLSSLFLKTNRLDLPADFYQVYFTIMPHTFCTYITGYNAI